MKLLEPNLPMDAYDELDRNSLLIAIPHNLDMLLKKFVTNMDLMKSFIGGEWVHNIHNFAFNPRNKWTISYINVPAIDLMRNNAVEIALVNKCKYLLFLDSDMSPFPIDLPYLMMDKMLSNDLKVMSSLCYARQGALVQDSHLQEVAPPYFEKLEDGKEIPFRPAPFTGLKIGNYLVGGACLMIDMDIFKDLKYPFFRFEIETDPKTKKMGWIGEDIYFSHKVLDAGYKIGVDTDTVIGHLSLFPMPYELYYRPSNLTTEIAKEIKKELNN